MEEPRLPARQLPYWRRVQLARQWAWDRGYPVPNKPGCLLTVIGVLGLAAAIVPGLLCLWFAHKRQRDYERDMRDLLMRWADAWEDARLDEEEEFEYFRSRERRRYLLQQAELEEEDPFIGEDGYQDGDWRDRDNWQ